MNHTTSQTQGSGPSLKRDQQGQLQSKKTASNSKKSATSRPSPQEPAMKQPSLVQYTTDAVITGAVKAKFMADSTVPFGAISVETSDGSVTLTGHVNQQQQIAQAEKIALSVKGVKAVRNQLQLKVN